MALRDRLLASRREAVYAMTPTPGRPPRRAALVWRILGPGYRREGTVSSAPPPEKVSGARRPSRRLVPPAPGARGSCGLKTLAGAGG